MRKALLILVVLVHPSLFAQEQAGIPDEQHFQWKPALLQSLEFLVIEHGMRMAGEPDTRSQLGGPFWRD